MLEKLFNKTNTDSKVQKEVDDNTRYGISSMRIIAKNTLTFKSIARDLKSLNGAFGNYLKLHNVKPAERGKLSEVKKSLSEHDDIKVARVKVIKERREKPKTFLASILDKIVKLIFAAVAGTLLSIGYVVYKLTEIISPYVSSFFDTVIEGISFLGTAIFDFIKETDFSDLFLSSFKKYLGFISFGLISEEHVDEALGEAGSFYKSVLIGIGGFIKDAVSWLAPKLQSIGRYIGKDILGVDLEKLEKRRTEKDALVKRSKELQKEYDELEKKDKDLTDKKTNLEKELFKKKEEQKKKKEAEQKKKEEKAAPKKEEAKPAPAPVPVPKKEEAKPAAKKEEVKPPPVAKPTPIPDVKPEAKEPTKEVTEKAPPSDAKPKKLSPANGESVMIDALNKSGIKDSVMRAAIMAQVGHESGNFTTLSENLNYSAAGLMKTFKKYFPTDDLAKEYQKNPPKIADRVYGGRMGNKPEGSGEGFLYRGRGFIQLTGKDNYKKYNYLNDPDSLLNPEKAADAAIKFMLNYKGSWDDIKKVTKYVNGGYIGLEDRQKHFQAYLNDPKIIGTDISEKSKSVSEGQREQSKPKNPTYVDARTVNNNIVQTNKNIVPAKV